MKLGLLLLVALPIVASAGSSDITITIKDHFFEPSEVRVPAQQKIRLVIKNQDSTLEEFESHELNREKVIPGGATANIYIGPLAPGRYPFFGEFHEKTARGVVIVE